MYSFKRINYQYTKYWYSMTRFLGPPQKDLPREGKCILFLYTTDQVFLYSHTLFSYTRLSGVSLHLSGRSFSLLRTHSLLSAAWMQSIHHSILDTVLSFLCFPSLNSFIYVSVYRSMIPEYISCPNLSSEFQIQMGPCLDDISPWISQRHHKSTCPKQNMSSDSTCSSSSICCL